MEKLPATSAAKASHFHFFDGVLFEVCMIDSLAWMKDWEVRETRSASSTANNATGLDRLAARLGAFTFEQAAARGSGANATGRMAAPIADHAKPTRA